MAPSRCINNLNPTILLRDTTEEAINDYVREHCSECYEIPPDFEFRDVAIFLNQEPIHDRTGLSDPVATSDEIFVAQALSGG